MKKRIRKTGEVVDVISYNKYTNTARNSELDWVSYIAVLLAMTVTNRHLKQAYRKRLNRLQKTTTMNEIPKFETKEKK